MRIDKYRHKIEAIKRNIERQKRIGKRLDETKECLHEDLYPDMSLQVKMGMCGHYLIHGYWECQKCGKWIFLECENEWDGRKGTKTKDGKYEFRIVDGKNKMVYIGDR